MTYSALDRFRDAIKGQPKDHAPIFPMIAAWAAAKFSVSPPAELAGDPPQRVVDAQIRAMESAGYDCLLYTSDAADEYYPV